MEQRRDAAAEKDAQIMHREEERAGGMGQSPSDAEKKDVQINLLKEECA